MVFLGRGENAARRVFVLDIYDCSYITGSLSVEASYCLEWK